MDHLSAHYARYGNGPLDPVDDPYTTPRRTEVNCTLSIESFRAQGTPWLRIPHHLTYSIALSALRRLSDWLLLEVHFGSVLVGVVDKALTGSEVTAGLILMKPYG